MKTSVKETAKKGAVSAVKGICGTLHITTMITTGLVVATRDVITDLIDESGKEISKGIAYSEGFIIEKIDGTPREETAGKRLEYTQQKMLETAMKADALRQRLQKGKQKATEAIADAKEKIVNVLTPDVPADADEEMVNDYRIAQLQSARTKLQQDESMDDKERNKRIYAINREIGQLRKLPKVDPAQAFDLATT